MKLFISSMIQAPKFNVRKFNDRFIKSNSYDFVWKDDQLISSSSSSNVNSGKVKTMKFFIKVKRINNIGKYWASIINSNFETIWDTGEINYNNIEAAAKVCKDKAIEQSIKIDAISLI